MANWQDLFGIVKITMGPKTRENWISMSYTHITLELLCIFSKEIVHIVILARFFQDCENHNGVKKKGKLDINFICITLEPKLMCIFSKEIILIGKLASVISMNKILSFGLPF